MEASSFLQEKEQKHNNPVGPTNFWLCLAKDIRE
jgi:hypothetical protein